MEDQSETNIHTFTRTHGGMTVNGAHRQDMAVIINARARVLSARTFDGLFEALESDKCSSPPGHCLQKFGYVVRGRVRFCPFACLTLSRTHTRKHTHTHTHTHTHIHTHTHTSTHTQALTHKHSHSHTHSLSLSLRGGIEP